MFNKVLKDKWGVVKGFDGQVLTQTMIDEKIADPNLKQAASKWIGKHVVDAGGLFAYAFRLFGMADGYDPNSDYISVIFNEFCEETGKLPKGGLVPGMVLFKRHGNTYNGVGLYIGNSSIIEAKSSKVGVIVSRLTSEWTWWGRLRNMNYDNQQTQSTVRKKDILDMRVLRGSVRVTGTTKPINVRSGKSMSAQIVDVLPIGTQATVLEDCGEFCRIQYVKTGYMKKEFLEEVQAK